MEASRIESRVAVRRPKLPISIRLDPDMHLFARDIEAMTIALTPHEQDGLEALLVSRLGVDREAEYAAVQQSVAKVLRRGTIASEKERRRLEEYADMLDATGGDPAEIEAVRRLLRFG